MTSKTQSVVELNVNRARCSTFCSTTDCVRDLSKSYFNSLLGQWHTGPKEQLRKDSLWLRGNETEERCRIRGLGLTNGPQQRSRYRSK